MIRLLPFILIPILIVGGLGYWRYKTSLQSLIAPETEESEQGPMEVPKTLPSSASAPLPSASSKPAAASQTQTSTALDSRVSTVESTVTELKARISALEKASPATVTSSQSTVYIPLGSGGGPWANVDWYLTPEYEISLDPSNYPGYTGMILEVTMRLVESAGTGSVRLYNVTDGNALSSELSTTSTTYALSTTSSFKLPTGTKTYRLQVKSTSEKNLFIQSARIKVKF